MVNPIITQTLPTLVGMHVVSHTTDTMFGRRGSHSQSRNKQKHGDTIIVGNRVYKLHTGDRGGRYYVRKGRKIYV
jgi:hypothetical protein